MMRIDRPIDQLVLLLPRIPARLNPLQLQRQTPAHNRLHHQVIPARLRKIPHLGNHIPPPARHLLRRELDRRCVLSVKVPHSHRPDVGVGPAMQEPKLLGQVHEEAAHGGLGAGGAVGGGKAGGQPAERGVEGAHAPVELGGIVAAEVAELGLGVGDSVDGVWRVADDVGELARGVVNGGG